MRGVGEKLPDPPHPEERSDEGSPLMLLEIKNIKKYFPIQRGFFHKRQGLVKAVDGVDLQIAAGENLGLVGESGCGKTTLGRIILRLLAPTAGEIFFEGREITRLPQRAMRPLRKDLQMVFQDPFSSLDPRFSVARIIQEAMTFDLGKTRQQKLDRIRHLLSAVRLPANILNRFPHEFSGGERQRIALARALAMNPKLLILDEAVSSLDVLIQAQLVDLLLELQKKLALTYLFISHNLRVVKKIASRIAVMYQGKIVEWASAQEIFAQPLHPYTKMLLAAAMEYKAVKPFPLMDFSEHSHLVDRGHDHWVMS